MQVITKMQVLFFTLLSVLLQVCVCQNCPLIPDRGQKEGALMARVGQETSLPYNKTERPPSFNQSLPRMTPAIRSLIPQAASADEMARSTFGRRMPSTARLCPQIRKDIIIGSWIFYRGLFCYVPPPFSGYRFFNIHCPCCKPCFFPSNVCGLYFCIPSLKRSYLFPAYCWRLPFFQRFGWRIIRFHTFHVCSCVNVLRIG